MGALGGRREITHLGRCTRGPLAQYSLLPLVFTLGCLKVAQLCRCRPHKLHLHPVLDARVGDGGVVGCCLLALIDEFLVLWPDSGELFETVVKVGERGVWQECERVRCAAVGYGEADVLLFSGHWRW